MVQLLSHLSVHGVHDDHLVLHAHIFSSRSKRDAGYEWGLYPSCNPQSDIVCDRLRCLRYEARSLLVLANLQLLTI